MKKVKSEPIALAWTSSAGARPILAASWSAAPSARLSCGIGSVKETWTMASPVVSPYGRMMSGNPCGVFSGVLTSWYLLPTVCWPGCRSRART